MNVFTKIKGLFNLSHDKKYNKEAKQTKRDKRRRKEERQNQLEIQHLVNEYKILKTQLGKPTYEIRIRNKRKDSIFNKIIIFDSYDIIVICGEKFSYRDIIGCTMTDSQSSITTSVTDGIISAKNGSVLGRAILGGIVGGGIGALAGAATSSKEVETRSEFNTVTNHSYMITIQLNNMQRPIIKIVIDNDLSTVQEIMAIFTIILRKNAAQ